jgi:hypothetical protein
LKITSTDQQIIKNPELSKADKADNLAGKKKPDSKVAADKSAAIKTDTVELSQKSKDLARAAKSGSGSKADGKSPTNTVQNIDENVLAKLLKMADKRSVIFGSSGIPSKTDEQEEAAKKSGKKIDFFL